MQTQVCQAPKSLLLTCLSCLSDEADEISDVDFSCRGPFSSSLSPPLLWEPLLHPLWQGPATTRYSGPGGWSHTGLPPGARAFRALSLPVEWEARLLIVSNIRASGPHKARPISRQRRGPVLRGQYKKEHCLCHWNLWILGSERPTWNTGTQGTLCLLQT